jgi:thimet oligopeptidase
MHRANWDIESTPLDRTAAELAADCRERLAAAKTFRDRLVEAPGPRTIENTLVPYNEMMMHLDAASAEATLFARVHPSAELRAAAEQAEQAVAKYVTELNLDRQLYDAFCEIDVSRADSATRYFADKRVRDFRRAGVDKPEEIRKRVAALNDEIVKLGQDFARNIRDDEREIVLASTDDLEGLPPDWVEKHRPAPDGKVRVSTRTPDYVPFATYARACEPRRALYREHKDRGHPNNLKILETILKKRHDLAHLLGYATWAEYVTEDKMIASAKNVRSFIDKVAQTCHSAAQRDYARLLARKRKDQPGATKVEDWEKAYYEQRVKTEDYAFDPQAVRCYFNFSDVLRGLLDLTSKLFGVTCRQATGLQLWHSDVTAWD